MITAGSGLGGFTAIANQPTYGAAFATPTRTLYFKTFKPTFDPHYVQGGPYLAGGRAVDIGSAHIKMYLDAKGTLTGDLMTTGAALLVATAFGSNSKLTQAGTTAAYELGGVGGFKLEIPESHNEKSESGTCFDLQAGLPYTNAEVNAYNFHSCMVTKAEFVFDRKQLLSYSFDLDAQYVETETALIAPVYTTSGVPFAMNSTSSAFKVGPPGSAVSLAGVRKMTVTLERKLALDRIYLGKEYKEIPVSNGLVDITLSVETDFTSGAKEVFAAFLTNTAKEIVCECFGAEIGTSGKKHTFQITMPNIFINSGAEPPLDGPDLVKNTMTAKATINAANEPAISGKLITADTTF